MKAHHIRHDAHAAGIHLPTLKILQHKPSEGIVADGAHISGAYPQLLRRHQRSGAGSSALYPCFHALQLGILLRKPIHDHQRVVYR